MRILKSVKYKLVVISTPIMLIPILILGAISVHRTTTDRSTSASIAARDIAIDLANSTRRVLEAEIRVAQIFAHNPILKTYLQY
jgi:hypothetical protein